MQKFFRVSEVARELGVSAEWLRDAEKRGKIPPAKRDINGWRVYCDEDVERIKRILIPA